MLDEIRELYEFNLWANRKYLDAVQGLDPGEFTRDMRSSFPSIQATLAHVLGAEWIWLERSQGVSPSGFPEQWDTSTPAALLARWEEFAADQSRFLAGLSEEALRANIGYRNVAGNAFTNVLWQMMRHVLNHSTYHRGQVATMLRQLGKAVPPTDLIVFYRDRG